MNRDEMARELIERLRNKLGGRLIRVVLFGSAARKDDTAESDIDCLAVVDRAGPEVNDAVDEVAGELLYQHCVVFSIIPVSEERLQAFRSNPFLMNVNREGVVLWQARG